MKNVTQPQVPGKHNPVASGNRKPENKDNLDARKNEEQDDKGEGTTHNKKEHHSDSRKHKP